MALPKLSILRSTLKLTERALIYQLGLHLEVLPGLRVIVRLERFVVQQALLFLINDLRVNHISLQVRLFKLLFFIIRSECSLSV